MELLPMSSFQEPWTLCQPHRFPSADFSKCGPLPRWPAQLWLASEEARKSTGLSFRFMEGASDVYSLAESFVGLLSVYGLLPLFRVCFVTVELAG
jgi:hypothetical protein